MTSKAKLSKLRKAELVDLVQLLERVVECVTVGADLLHHREERMKEERSALVAMVVRAVRSPADMVEGRARANLLEDLERVAPGTLAELPEELQPERLRGGSP